MEYKDTQLRIREAPGGINSVTQIKRYGNKETKWRGGGRVLKRRDPDILRLGTVQKHQSINATINYDTPSETM